VCTLPQGGRALRKLGAHLDAQRPSARPPGRLARALQPWPLRYVALAQLATIAVLGALWLYHPQPESVYRTLSSADASATRTGTLVVVFDPEAREPEMRQALRAAAAHIVSGPTQQGAYLVDVADPDLERAADNLRHQHAVVLVAPLQRADKP